MLQVYEVISLTPMTAHIFNLEFHSYRQGRPQQKKGNCHHSLRAPAAISVVFLQRGETRRFVSTLKT